jgi:hypothetical protein
VVNDAYVEHNKMKRQAWLTLPLALIVIGLIVLFGDYDRGKLAQPEVLASSPQGRVLELPVFSSTPEVNWQTVRTGDDGKYCSRSVNTPLISNNYERCWKSGRSRDRVNGKSWLSV